MTDENRGIEMNICILSSKTNPSTQGMNYSRKITTHQLVLLSFFCLLVFVHHVAEK